MIQWLINIFKFSENTPLIFTQIDFWVFFFFVYLGFCYIQNSINKRNIYLFLLSLFFYYKTSGIFVFLLLFSTVVDFYLGKWVYFETRPSRRNMYVFLSVFVNLLILSYFKYAYFFADCINYIFGTELEVVNYLALWGNIFSGSDYFTVDKIILPVGISFYTFQTISYTVDIYRGKTKPLKSILDFGFYVTFFPQLVAGPIVRAENFVPQIGKETKVSVEDFNKGTFLILKGLIKKMVFADFIAGEFLDRVFESPSMYSGFTNIMALVGYSLQVYGDFSGYTDIAIGLALLMGFQLPKNFDSPYKATSCGNFWKRWHISLSSWLQDYLYIPLGGNRGGSVASIVVSILFVVIALLAADSPVLYITTGVLLICGTILTYKSQKFRMEVSKNINLLLTMLIGGLWHGASWKFIVWGGLNGLGVVFSKYWKKISPYQNSTHPLAHFWKVFSTFCFIVFVRLYFRGEDLERINLWYDQVFYNMNLSSAFDVLWYFRWAFVVMVVGYVTHWLPTSTKDKIEAYYNSCSIYAKAAVAVVVAIVCVQASSSTYQPFIYFQF